MGYEMLDQTALKFIDDMAHSLYQRRSQNVLRINNGSFDGGQFDSISNGQTYTTFVEQSPEIHIQLSVMNLKQHFNRRVLRTAFMRAVAAQINSYQWLQAQVFAMHEEDNMAYDQRYIAVSTKPLQQQGAHMTLDQLMSQPAPRFDNGY